VVEKSFPSAVAASYPTTNTRRFFGGLMVW
jgi:hypothetical protein